MAQSAPSSAYVSRHAAIVRDKALKRGLIQFGRDVLEAALNSPDDGAGLVDQASSALEKLALARTRGEPALAADGVLCAIEFR